MVKFNKALKRARKGHCPICNKPLVKTHEFMGNYGTDGVHKCPLSEEVYKCPEHGVLVRGTPSVTMNP